MARLVLNRRTGESLRIGYAARVTVRDRRGACILIAVAAPLALPVADEDETLRPTAITRDGARYLLWLLAGESLRIGEATLVVGDAPGTKRKPRGGQRQVRIAVTAPCGVRVSREEIARIEREANPGRIAEAHGYLAEDAA